MIKVLSNMTKRSYVHKMLMDDQSNEQKGESDIH